MSQHKSDDQNAKKDSLESLKLSAITCTRGATRSIHSHYSMRAKTFFIVLDERLAQARKKKNDSRYCAICAAAFGAWHAAPQVSVLVLLY
jgi:hypothetical protein